MILIIDLCWKKDSLSRKEFVEPIAAICRRHTSTVVRHFSELMPEDIDACQKVVLCGTALKDNAFTEPDTDASAKLGWLKTIGKPVLGICAGMQILAGLFGVPRIASKEIGMKRITVLKENILFPGHTLDVYCLHSFACSPAVAHDFDVLARSELCVQAIRHKTLPLYGVLFHPEVRNEAVVKNFLELG